MKRRRKVREGSCIFVVNEQLLVFFQRRLGDAAKKAISKLQVRTIRKGDKVRTTFPSGKDLVNGTLVFPDSQSRREKIKKEKDVKVCVYTFLELRMLLLNILSVFKMHAIYF